MNYPALVDKEVEALVRTGLYKSHDEVISDTICNLLLNNKPLRIELTIDLFRSDEVSLGRAAEIAGTDRWQFQDILKERQIPILLEPETAEAMDEIEKTNLTWLYRAERKFCDRMCVSLSWIDKKFEHVLIWV